MWVEISSRTRQTTLQVQSSSSWGCELKYSPFTGNVRHISHPLREDVSWNGFAMDSLADEEVILFVRMWVEMLVRVQLGQLHTVILFVRMWVEIVIILPVTAPLLSSSSWGCELKYLFFQCPCDRIQSSSSWGCELKWCWIRSCWCKLPSSSSWRCELKSWRVRC